MCNCTSEVWSFGPSRNDGISDQPKKTSLIQRSWIRLLTSALLADRVLPGLHLHLGGRERRRRRAALLEVLVGLRFLLFLVAAHLTLGHDVSPCARLKDVARAEHSKCAGVCNAGARRLRHLPCRHAPA